MVMSEAELKRVGWLKEFLLKENSIPRERASTVCEYIVQHVTSKSDPFIEQDMNQHNPYKLKSKNLCSII